MNYSFRLLSCVNQGDRRKVTNWLEEHQFLLFILDGSNIHDIGTFFQSAAQVFPQDPPLVGSSWNGDAFVDSLFGGLDGLGQAKVAVLWTDVNNMLDHGLNDLLTIIGCFEQLAMQVVTPKSGISQPVTVLIFLFGHGPNFPAL